jgi:hypothetical protein
MSTRKKNSRRDVPVVVNNLVINGQACSLGDLRKADFAAVHDPKASVISIQKTLIEILDILRGGEDANA